ncbi:MAG: hypothetical protein J7639_10010 [Paenibacillaceae bacterium]|nr:hypothetical protein [Paenibacillaceae bacterium]
MSSAMNGSMKASKRVAAAALRERIETVRALQENEIDAYEIVKDRTNGEHYLLYYYVHLNIADGSKETYYHLMPIDNDDVLAIVLGEQPYEYPEHWHRPFLRNSAEDDGYVWFDPSAADVYDSFEQTGLKLQEALLEFKRNGSLDEEAVRKLLEKLDQTD